MRRLRIAFFTTADYAWSFPICAATIREIAAQHEVVGVYHFTEKMPGRRGPAILSWYLQVFGPVNCFIFWLIALKTRIGRLMCPIRTWKQLASRYGFQLKNGETPNTKEVCDWVKENQIDIIFIMLNDILKKEILRAPRVGFINKHAGLLPSCRGAYPFLWAKLNGHATGVTFHEVDSGIDTGRILVQRRCPGDSERQNISMIRFYMKITELFPEMAGLSLERLAGREFTEPPPGSAPSYYGFPTRSDYARYRKLGYKVAEFSDVFYKAETPERAIK